MTSDKPSKTVDTDNNLSTNSVSTNSNNGFGLEQNITCLLCYLFLGLGGLVFILLEKENKQVRFAAAQSIVLAISILVVSIVYGTFSAILESFLTIWSTINTFIIPFSTLAFLAIWITLMYKSYKNQEWQLPIIGNIARSFSK